MITWMIYIMDVKRVMIVVRNGPSLLDGRVYCDMQSVNRL